MSASTTPISTHRISLMVYNPSGTGTDKYEQLCCIKNIPDLDPKIEPDQIETTTFCDEYHEFMDGLKNRGDDLEFLANYIKGSFDTINGYGSTKKQLAVYFNTGDSFDGENGKFYFGGEVSARVNSAGVGDAVEMTIRVKLKEAVSTTEPSHT